jgi:hypothetical protein
MLQPICSGDMFTVAEYHLLLSFLTAVNLYQSQQQHPITTAISTNACTSACSITEPNGLHQTLVHTCRRTSDCCRFATAASTASSCGSLLCCACTPTAAATCRKALRHLSPCGSVDVAAGRMCYNSGSRLHILMPHEQLCGGHFSAISWRFFCGRSLVLRLQCRKQTKRAKLELLDPSCCQLQC